MASFESDLAFQKKMQRHIDAVYQKRWPGIIIDRDCRAGPAGKHADRKRAIDVIVEHSLGWTLTIQEKVRRGKVWTYSLERDREPDFTQEYRNAVGTEHEEPGEWFHLWAQLYFFGWESPNEDGLIAWLMMDIFRYKMIVHAKGGLDRLGRLNPNARHGRSNFYSIPISRLHEHKAFPWHEGLERWLK
uniref:Uncharacterized protein n=1 Tax=viral metagenome TaxID=1070528 RepID=A0A6M3LA47_9ZZZZ